MIVCHCKGLSDQDIREVVRAGAVAEELVAEECAAGATCGGCRPIIREIIASETASTELLILSSSPAPIATAPSAQ